MCAKYVMQEAVDLNNEGKTLRYPRMVMEQCCETDELARWVASGTTYGEGEVRGILSEVARWMALTMAQGRSVRLEGLGLFTPALGLRRGKEREEADGSTGRRNASSIRVSRIHFRADRELVRRDKQLQYLPTFVLDQDLGAALNKQLRIQELESHLPGLHCGSCGAPSCHAFAEDVVLGRASEEDCIFKVRERMQYMAGTGDADEYLPAPFRQRRTPGKKPEGGSRN